MKKRFEHIEKIIEDPTEMKNVRHFQICEDPASLVALPLTEANSNNEETEAQTTQTNHCVVEFLKFINVLCLKLQMSNPC